DVRIGARPRQALAQGFQGGALQGSVADRLDAYEQGRHDHQGEPQQQLALQGHMSKLLHTEVLRSRASRALLSSPLRSPLPSEKGNAICAVVPPLRVWGEGDRG